jgi:hypothetical protein
MQRAASRPLCHAPPRDATIPHAAGIGRSTIHDAAGIGRSTIHDAAGIGRSTIHDAAGGLKPIEVEDGVEG